MDNMTHFPVLAMPATAAPTGIRPGHATGPGAPSLPLGVAANGDPETAARDFEAVYLNTMLKSMFTDLQQNGLNNGQAESTWRGMLVEQYARSIAEAGGIGIADAVRAELIALQEANG